VEHAAGHIEKNVADINHTHRAGYVDHTHRTTHIDHPTSGTSDKVHGKFHEAKGDLKEGVGKVVHSDRMRAEGAIEKNAGKIEQKEGDIKRAMGQ
jgi:uncharacterized protein YjbJ (UPF0337 family)